MDEKSLVSYVTENALTGTLGATMLALLYKMWRILKTDRKVDDLDSNERAFRDELRQEIVLLKDEKKILEEKNKTLLDEHSELKAALLLCQKKCPNQHE